MQAPNTGVGTSKMAGVEVPVPRSSCTARWMSHRSVPIVVHIDRGDYSVPSSRYEYSIRTMATLRSRLLTQNTDVGDCEACVAVHWVP